MDREREFAHLQKAEQDIANAYRRVADQRQLIADLRAGGHPTDIAQKLLDSMLVGLRAKHGHRNVILEVLGMAPPGTAGDGPIDAAQARVSSEFPSNGPTALWRIGLTRDRQTRLAMSTSEDYRRKAQQCRQQAKLTQDRDVRDSWLDVAGSWLRLAEQAEALHAREEGRPHGEPTPSR